jgi:hypothetical protein
MPENLKHARNNAIVIGFLEFICCFLSFGFYDLRRSKALLVVIILTVLTTAYGFRSKLQLNYCGILFHAMYTVPVIGGFYIYQIVDFIFGTDSGSTEDGRLSGSLILVLSSLPLFFLFLMGIYSIYLVSLIDDELDERKKQNQRVGVEEPAQPRAQRMGQQEMVREVHQRNIQSYNDPEQQAPA